MIVDKPVRTHHSGNGHVNKPLYFVGQNADMLWLHIRTACTEKVIEKSGHISTTVVMKMIGHHIKSI